MRTLKQNHTEAVKPPGKTVSVTYRLKKSAFAAILENGFSIGYVNIDLQKDQDADPNGFSTKGAQSYRCLMEKGGLRVTLYAEGKTGDFWTLELEIDGKAVAANPVSVETDGKGHLDYDNLIS
ncbi:hypothetical protein [Pedobacter hartonius]|nr:hypothetical protein [Pedobacter hartonius]